MSSHLAMTIKLDDMDGETRAECRDAANSFYKAIRVLAGVDIDVNETDDGYLFGQITIYRTTKPMLSRPLSASLRSLK
jgi:hypothetical protein